MAEETPAATMELDNDNVETALMLKSSRRHHEIDDIARIYQAVTNIIALIHQNKNTMWKIDSSGSFDTFYLLEELNILADACKEHALEEHEHAVRWTLDVYGEMEYEPSE